MSVRVASFPLNSFACLYHVLKDGAKDFEILLNGKMRSFQKCRLVVKDHFPNRYTFDDKGNIAQFRQSKDGAWVLPEVDSEGYLSSRPASEASLPESYIRVGNHIIEVGEINAVQ